MSEKWVRRGLGRLLDTATCPGCGAYLDEPECATCGIDLRGRPGWDLANASQAVYAALIYREQILDFLRNNAQWKASQGAYYTAPQQAPAAPSTPPAPIAHPAPYAAPPPEPGQPRPYPQPAFPAPAPTRTSSIGVQQILSVASVGLIAVAALVFVFFTFRDDTALRATLTGAGALIAAGAAIAMRGRQLRTSAESLAALAVILILVAIDLAVYLPDAHARMAARAGALAIVVVALLASGYRSRLRAWITSAVLLAPAVPLMAAMSIPVQASYAATTFGAGSLGLILCALLGKPLASRVSKVFPDELRVERKILAIVQSVAYPIAVLRFLNTPTMPGPAPFAGGALAILCAAGVALTVAKVEKQRGWYAVAGATAAVAVALAGLRHTPWSLAVAAGGILVLILLAIAVLSRRHVDAKIRAVMLMGMVTIQWALTVSAAVMVAYSMEMYVESVLTNDRGAASGQSAMRIDTSTALLTPAVCTLIAAALTFCILGRLRIRVPAQAQPRPAAVTGVPAPATGTTWGKPRFPLLPRTTQNAAVVATSRALAPLAILGALLGAVSHPSLPFVVGLGLEALLAAGGIAVAWRSVPLTVAISRWIAHRRIGGHPAMSPVRTNEWKYLRVITLIGVYTFTAILAAASWGRQDTALAAGGVVLLLLLFSRRVMPPALGPNLVAVGYGYALIVCGAGLSWTTLTPVAIICLVSATASLVALVVTVLPRVGSGSWFAVLAVTSIPFMMGVATLLYERSWWSAGAALVMFALESVLVATHRPGTPIWVRAVSAWLGLPTLSVAIVSAGAMVITGSASPVVLPVITVAVVAVAVSAAPVAGRLARRAQHDQATRLRLALEASVLVTAAIDILLVIVRPAAGADTAIIVQMLLAAGAGAVAMLKDRRPVWWLSAVLWTSALWTALNSQGIGTVEAYTLPPAIAATCVAVLLARRSRRKWIWGLATSGMVLLVAPSLVAEIADTGQSVLRTTLVLGAGVLALATCVSLTLRRPLSRWRASFALLWAGAALLSSLAALIAALAVAGREPIAGSSPAALFLESAAWAAGGAALAAGSGWRFAALVRPRRVRRIATTWRFAPALLLLVWGAVAGGRIAATTSYVLLAGELALLVVVLVSARGAVRGVHGLPPVLYTWILAVITGAGAWAPQLVLRFEAYSVPLGLGLMVAGWFALGGPATRESGTARTRPSLVNWPAGFAGSWRTVAPGVIALCGPLIVATHRDPVTWRASTVVAIALALVLVGARQKLAAPFILGVTVLPVEIVTVFLTQLGTKISAGAWMLTLAAAGGLLLIIAIYWERQTARSGGTASYIRDLQ